MTTSLAHPVIFEKALDSLLPALQGLRLALHRHPDLSGEENASAERVKDFLEGFGLEPWAEGVGGHGLVYRIEGALEGSAILLRADLDALPMLEATELAHASTIRRCGTSPCHASSPCTTFPAILWGA